MKFGVLRFIFHFSGNVFEIGFGTRTADFLKHCSVRHLFMNVRKLLSHMLELFRSATIQDSSMSNPNDRPLTLIFL